MNRFKLFKAGINANEGIKRFNGNAEIYEKYLMQFPDNTDYPELCRRLDAGDVKGAFAAAHALKGVAGNLSMEELYLPLSALVDELRAGELDRARERLAPVNSAYENVMAALAEQYTAKK